MEQSGWDGDGDGDEEYRAEAKRRSQQSTNALYVTCCVFHNRRRERDQIRWYFLLAGNGRRSSTAVSAQYTFISARISRTLLFSARHFRVFQSPMHSLRSFRCRPQAWQRLRRITLRPVCTPLVQPLRTGTPAKKGSAEGALTAGCQRRGSRDEMMRSAHTNRGPGPAPPFLKPVGTPCCSQAVESGTVWVYLQL